MKGFSLNPRDAKLLGVCAGIGDRLGIDPTIVRVAWVAVPLLTPIDFSTALIAYAVAGLIGFIGRHRARSTGERPERNVRPSVHRLRTELDPIDRRLMAIDDHLARRNTALEREIAALKEER